MNKNQPADIPITEEGLIKKGFDNYIKFHPEYFYLSIGSLLIEASPKRGIYCVEKDGVSISIKPKSIQDLNLLIRLLGGSNE